MTHATLSDDGARSGPGLGEVRTERIVLFPTEDPLVLETGARLAPVEVAYETYGTLDADGTNAVVLCHALTGDAHAAGHHGDPSRRGWWDALVGPGRPIDTDRFFVVCANLLGGCRGTTGPSSTDPRAGRAYGLDFPALAVADLVRVQRALVRALGIRRLRAAIGGSLGGMQVLEWALQAPEEIERAVVVCASARLSAQNVALSTAAREGILRDPDFQDGRYPGTGRIPAAGLAAARMLGHVTYVTEEALETKFGRRRRPADAGAAADGAASTTDRAAGGPAAEGPRAVPPQNGHDWFRPSFEVEHYLDHQATSFLERFDALSYLWLTKVMDDFAPFAAPDAAERLARVRTAGTTFLVESFSSDWRFGPAHSDHIADQLTGAGVPVRREDVASPWGHDSFLLPLRDHLDVVAEFLAEPVLSG
jgi:homoserine O-acetyltransferase